MKEANATKVQLTRDELVEMLEGASLRVTELRQDLSASIKNEDWATVKKAHLELTILEVIQNKLTKAIDRIDSGRGLQRATDHS